MLRRYHRFVMGWIALSPLIDINSLHVHTQVNLTPNVLMNSSKLQQICDNKQDTSSQAKENT